MIQIIEITQLVVVSLICIMAIGAILWVMYKVLNNK